MMRQCGCWERMQASIAHGKAFAKVPSLVLTIVLCRTYALLFRAAV